MDSIPKYRFLDNCKHRPTILYFSSAVLEIGRSTRIEFCYFCSIFMLRTCDYKTGFLYYFKYLKDEQFSYLESVCSKQNYALKRLN